MDRLRVNYPELQIFLTDTGSLRLKVSASLSVDSLNQLSRMIISKIDEIEATERDRSEDETSSSGA